jgi:dihydroorotate dehydrogenase (NAD+) catalytic subunit
MPKVDFIPNHALLNAAGTLGFAPDLHGALDLTRLGAFVTNPISLAARRPTTTACCLNYPGGFLLHNGYPNPGLKRTIQRYAEAWAHSPIPVIVSILPQEADELQQFLDELEDVPGVVGLEIGIPSSSNATDLVAFTEAAFGELAVLLRVPVDQAVSLVYDLGDRLPEAGLMAISLGAPRGALPGTGNKLIFGRLFGPSLFPQTLAVTQRLMTAGIPLISGCGVYHAWQAETLLTAGALAVQVDSVLWRDPALQSWET